MTASRALLGLLLVVLSNLLFLPVAFVAYKRYYFVEAICYFAVFFFSTFYHACDAATDSIGFCMSSLASLQHSDFFCAAYGIWMTLIAIANLPRYWPNACHVIGAVTFSYTVAMDKMSPACHVVPVVVALLIIAVSWYLKWRKVRGRFLEKKYLYIYMPCGVAVVAVGLICFCFLQNNENYTYFHSLWHVLMAVGVILFLPRPDTFISNEEEVLEA